MLGLQRKVVTFAKIASDSSAQMATNAKKVKKTIGDAEKDLLALQGRIAELQRRLGVTTTEAKNSMSGAAMKGATITMTMLAFTVGNNFSHRWTGRRTHRYRVQRRERGGQEQRSDSARSGDRRVASKT